jgi:hypothetical protein
LKDILLPSSDEEWYELTERWDSKMEKHFTICYLKVTTLAIDGIVIESTEPTSADVNRYIVGNYNRKGYFAIVG